MLKTNKRGFTLIELLVVIAIIGLLATIVLVSLNNARNKANDAKVKSDLSQIMLGMEMYYADNSEYEAGVGTCADGLIASAATNGNICSGFKLQDSTGATVYIQRLPDHPVTATNYKYTGTVTSYTLTGALKSGTWTCSNGACY